MNPDTDLLVVGGQMVRRRPHGYEVAPFDVAISEGRIADLIPAGRPRPRHVRQELSADGCLVVPGFVNAHTHSYAMLGRTLGDGRPLESWMPYANTVTLNRTDSEVKLSALLSCIEMARSGTTTVLDHLGGRVESLGAAAEAYLEFGMRVVLAPMISDVPLHRTVGVAQDGWPPELWRELEAQPTSSADGLLASTRSLLQEWHERAGRIRVFVGPSGPQRCTDRLLRGCAQLAKDFDTGVHTHLLETSNQAVVTSNLYRDSTVEYLDAMGLISQRFVGAHGVWCSNTDLRLLGERGAALVHNPWSNLCLGSGLASLGSWRRHGVTVALGTDGANAGCDLSMPLAMRLATSLHRANLPDPVDWPTPEETFTAATVGGATALGWENEIGCLERGMAADLAAIDMSATIYRPRRNLVAQLVYGETGANVRHTVIHGRVVMQDRTLTTIDEHAVLGQVENAAAELSQRNRKLSELAERQEPTLTRAALSAQTSTHRRQLDGRDQVRDAP